MSPLLEHFIYSKKNRKLIMKYISHYSRTQEEYNTLLYQVTGMLIQNNCKTKKELIQTIITHIHNDILTPCNIWKQSIYDKYRYEEQEQIDFILNPFETDEGVVECGKCGSYKTIVFQMQTRSADEPTSTFAQCVECKHRWRDN